MIGIFDSGLGGLTALREAVRLLPGRDIVYFGDTGRIPYGTRSRETIIRYARQDMRFLCGEGVDVVLAACGTVSSTALDTLRGEFDLPIIGVVEGAAAAAVRATANGRVGVIATGATVSSGAFPRAMEALDPRVKVTAVACPPAGFPGGERLHRRRRPGGGAGAPGLSCPHSRRRGGYPDLGLYPFPHSGRCHFPPASRGEAYQFGGRGGGIAGQKDSARRRRGERKDPLFCQ